VRESLDGIVDERGGEPSGGVDRAQDGVSPGPAPNRKDARPPSIESRINEWDRRLGDIVDDEVEGGGEEPSDVELIAEGLGLLQHAVDRALATRERQTDQAAGEAADAIAALRQQVARLEDARRSDQERHRREVARLAERMETLETTIRADVGEVHAALRIEAAEAAEGRSIARLKQSSWMRRHNATVGLKLAQRELASVKG